MNHFTIEELCMTSHRSIPNTPDAVARANLETLVAKCLDPIRNAIKVPVRINSGYRSRALNKAIGGSSSSQHSLGEAVDFSVPSYTLEQFQGLFKSIASGEICPFDQLIWERNLNGNYWIHISYRASRLRKQVLVAIPKKSGGWDYRPWSGK